MLFSNNNLLALFIVIAGAVIFASCNAKSGNLEKITSEKEMAWKSISQDGYMMSFPSDWKLDLSKRNGTSFLLYAPVGRGATKFKSNINLISRKLEDQKIDLDVYSKVSENQVKKSMPDAQIIVNERLESGGHPYNKMVYKATTQGMDLIFHQNIWVVDHTSYVLTLTSSAEQYGNLKDTADKIMTGFKITG